MEEYSKRVEKYMRSLWGLSDDDGDDYNNDDDDVGNLNNDQDSNNAKLEHNNDEVKKMELNKKQTKKEKLDMQRDELGKTKEASFGRSMLKRTEPNKMKEPDAKKYRKKKRRKKKKMIKSTFNNTRENCVSETETETETETIKGKETIQKNLQKSERKNINKVERENSYKKKKESSISMDTKLEKQKHLKDIFGAISNTQDELVKNGNTNIMSTTKEKEKKIGKRREKGANEKKGSTNKNKLTKKETTDIKNILKGEREEFKNMVREVRNVAKQHLNKFQKLILLNHEIRELGGKFDKSRKMPYPELISRKRAVKKYMKERKEMERSAGVKFQSGNYTDMQDVFRKKKKEKKKKRQHSSKLF